MHYYDDSYNTFGNVIILMIIMVYKPIYTYILIGLNSDFHPQTSSFYPRHSVKNNKPANISDLCKPPQ